MAATSTSGNAGEQDPVAFRLAHSENDPRFAAVIREAKVKPGNSDSQQSSILSRQKKKRPAAKSQQTAKT